MAVIYQDIISMLYLTQMLVCHLSDAFYNAIAWMGLKGTKAWNDPSVDQAAINSIINNAVTNETHTCTN